MQRLEPRLVAPASKVFVLNRFNLLTSASVSRSGKWETVYAGITKQEEHTCIHEYGYLKVIDGEVVFENQVSTRGLLAGVL